MGRFIPTIEAPARRPRQQQQQHRRRRRKLTRRRSRTHYSWCFSLPQPRQSQAGQRRAIVRSSLSLFPLSLALSIASSPVYIIIYTRIVCSRALSKEEQYNCRRRSAELHTAIYIYIQQRQRETRARPFFIIKAAAVTAAQICSSFFLLCRSRSSLESFPRKSGSSPFLFSGTRAVTFFSLFIKESATASVIFGAAG